MVSRRALLGIGLCGLPMMLRGRARRYEAGDLVKLVALPSHCRQRWKNPDMNWHAALVRDCLGGTYRVTYVGEDGRPSLDVTTTAIARNPGLIGCEVSVEPGCVVLVARQSAWH
jgi:hypothetical protein